MKYLMRLMAGVLLVVIVGAMVGPFQNVEAATNIWDKAAHFVAFGLILWSIGVLFRRLPRTLAALAALVVGGAVEIIQGWVGRDASWPTVWAFCWRCCFGPSGDVSSRVRRFRPEIPRTYRPPAPAGARLRLAAEADLFTYSP